MRILIAEDDLASRKAIYTFLSKFGDCDMTVDGMEAVDAFHMALDDEMPYDLVCLDIMMPEMDGYQALKSIRELELKHGVDEEDGAKIIMTTALNESSNVNKAYDLGCVAYAAKPIDQAKFQNVMQMLDLIP